MEHARVRSSVARTRLRLTSVKAHPLLKGFFEDWDYRQERVTGVPRHFLGSGHPIPVFGPLPRKKDDQ
jgi:hypothetical protein